MITRLKTKNFTILKEADIRFSPHLNVIIGENGSGKTHVIKLLYSILSAYSSLRSGGQNADAPISKQIVRQRIADKLRHIFMPVNLGRLTTRAPGRVKTEVAVEFSNKAKNIAFSFATNSKTEVGLDRYQEKALASSDDRAVYFPAKELLSIYPNFASLYEEYHLPYDETYLDTIRLLGLPYAKGPRKPESAKMLELIESAIGGTIRLDADVQKFHLILTGEENKGNMEIDLVAEGWRKLGMLAQVILNNALRDKGCLFWDEPESNLNPKLIKVVAEVLYKIAIEGNVQVFVTTHSLFLLREIEMLSVKFRRSADIRYIGITGEGGIDQGNSSTALHTLTVLDEEIAQTERVMSVGV